MPSGQEWIALAFLLFSTFVTVAFFAAALVLLNLGHRAGRRHLAGAKTGQAGGIGSVEGAVFALLGLLLAFSVSGALQRYDERRTLIIQEANAIATAYDRLDLLEPEFGQKLKPLLKRYLQTRIDLYRAPISFSLLEGTAIYSREHLRAVDDLKTQLWNGAVVPCRPKSANECTLVLTALNGVFDAARLRSGINRRHPPQVLYIMLFGLGLGGSFLAGFSMAGAANKSWYHMIIFASALALALFIVTDLEFPRLGIFQVSYFDQFLVDVLRDM